MVTLYTTCFNIINIVTCHLRSQPIQRFVAGQQLRNTQQVLEKLLGSRLVGSSVFYVVRLDAISRRLPVVRDSWVTVEVTFSNSSRQLSVAGSRESSRRELWRVLLWIEDLCLTVEV
jgi:hypothetical protein